MTTYVNHEGQVRELACWGDRLIGWMFSTFGAIALGLASSGIFGVLSYAVSQRRQEIGVRVALGASRGQIFGLVMARAARLAAVGVMLGIVGAFAVTRVIASQLYNVSATDPLSFATTSIFLALVAIAASVVPAQRATTVDPNISRARGMIARVTRTTDTSPPTLFILTI